MVNPLRAAAGARGAAARATTRTPSQSPPRTPQDCECGCGEQTRGGTYRQGHASRHRTDLINLIIATQPDTTTYKTTLDTITRHGWLEHLDRARLTRYHLPPTKPAKPTPTDHPSRHTMLSDLIAAGERLKVVDRYSGVGKIDVTRKNYIAILDAPVDELYSWPSTAGTWQVGDTCDMVLSTNSDPVPVTIVEIGDSHAKITAANNVVISVPIISLGGTL